MNLCKWSNYGGQTAGKATVSLTRWYHVFKKIFVFALQQPPYFFAECSPRTSWGEWRHILWSFRVVFAFSCGCRDFHKHCRCGHRLFLKMIRKTMLLKISVYMLMNSWYCGLRKSFTYVPFYTSLLSACCTEHIHQCSLISRTI